MIIRLFLIVPLLFISTTLSHALEEETWTPLKIYPEKIGNIPIKIGDLKKIDITRGPRIIPDLSEWTLDLAQYKSKSFYPTICLRRENPTSPTLCLYIWLHDPRTRLDRHFLSLGDDGSIEYDIADLHHLFCINSDTISLEQDQELEVHVYAPGRDIKKVTFKRIKDDENTINSWLYSNNTLTIEQSGKIEGHEKVYLFKNSNKEGRREREKLVFSMITKTGTFIGENDFKAQQVIEVIDEEH